MLRLQNTTTWLINLNSNLNNLKLKWSRRGWKGVPYLQRRTWQPPKVCATRRGRDRTDRRELAPPGRRTAAKLPSKAGPPLCFCWTKTKEWQVKERTLVEMKIAWGTDRRIGMAEDGATWHRSHDRIKLLAPPAGVCADGYTSYGNVKVKFSNIAPAVQEFCFSNKSMDVQQLCRRGKFEIFCRSSRLLDCRLLGVFSKIQM